MWAMYLRRHDKKVAGEDYEYWSLVESVRTARGPRQRIVATIGKLPGLDREERIGWDEIGRILSGRPRPEASLFNTKKGDRLLFKMIKRIRRTKRDRKSSLSPFLI